jgi:hypothetical protein
MFPHTHIIGGEGLTFKEDFPIPPDKSVKIPPPLTRIGNAGSRAGAPRPKPWPPKARGSWG